MTTLGEAFIEVHADTKPFAREIGPQLKTILDGVSTKAQKQGSSVGKKVSEGIADGFDKRSNFLRNRFGRFGRWLDDQGHKWHDNLQKSFTNLAKGNFILTRLFGALILKIGGATKRVAAFTKGLFSLGRGIGEVAVGVGQLALEGFKSFISVGGDMAKVASTLGSGFARIGTALAAAAAEAVAAAPAFIAVLGTIALLAAAVGVLAIAITVAIAPFAALLNLALLIPTALTALLAVVFPLVIALKDLGDAFGLVFEKDPKKFAEGLKQLPPVMRELVGVLRPFRKQFQQLIDTVQKAFFEPILKQLGPTLDEALSVLLVGFSNIASALGGLVASILKLFADPAFTTPLLDVMMGIADFISANTPMITQLMMALAAMSQAALPVVLELLNKFGGFLGEFAAWITQAITDGRFQQWLDTGIAALKVIWGLVKALIGLFAALFSKIQAGGRDFLTILTDAINKFTAWIKSPEGTHALENMVKLAKLIAKAFEVALGFIIQMVEKVSWLVDKINWINNHTGNPLGTLGKAIQWAGGFSGGGVVPNDGLAMVHNNEAILDPANSNSRNRAILADAGMLDVLPDQGTTVVNVFVGNEQLDARTDYRIEKANRRTARSLSTGPRS